MIPNIEGIKSEKRNKCIEKCISCQSKTFASVERSKHWSIKNKKKPIEVFKSSAEQFIFDCDKCNNEFKSKLCHIVIFIS